MASDGGQLKLRPFSSSRTSPILCAFDLSTVRVDRALQMQGRGDQCSNEYKGLKSHDPNLNVEELGLGRLWSQEVIVTDDFCAFSGSVMRRLLSVSGDGPARVSPYKQKQNRVQMVSRVCQFLVSR